MTPATERRRLHHRRKMIERREEQDSRETGILHVEPQHGAIVLNKESRQTWEPRRTEPRPDKAERKELATLKSLEKVAQTAARAAHAPEKVIQPEGQRKAQSLTQPKGRIRRTQGRGR